MVNVEIKTLKDVGLKDIHASWTRAFSDYPVDIQMTEEMLGSHLAQNDLDTAASVGAFDGENIVGLWLNGLREIEGKLCAYDAGTAIWPEYRGRGLSKLLATRSTEILKKMRVKEYFLEVISDNTKAYNVYLKDGFKVCRTFSCFKTNAPRNDKRTLPDDVMIREENFSESIIRELPPTEYTPSWQNTIRSMLNVKETVRMITARRCGKLAGYGLIQTHRGRISELGFTSDAWETELPSAVLNELCNIADRDKDVAVINVDDGASRTLGLLANHGFKKFVGQFEIKKELTENIV
jgi:ribosomal protein S18 acetylase RimI-like enzyme